MSTEFKRKQLLIVVLMFLYFYGIMQRALMFNHEMCTPFLSENVRGKQMLGYIIVRIDSISSQSTVRWPVLSMIQIHFSANPRGCSLAPLMHIK